MHLAPLGAPTGIFRLTPCHPLGPARICLSLGGCSERRPWVRVASTLPAGALPLPANRTPPEGAPRRVDRDMSPLAKISPYVKSRIRYWKRKWEMGGKLGTEVILPPSKRQP